MHDPIHIVRRTCDPGNRDHREICEQHFGQSHKHLGRRMSRPHHRKPAHIRSARSVEMKAKQRINSERIRRARTCMRSARSGMARSARSIDLKLARLENQEICGDDQRKQNRALMRQHCARIEDRGGDQSARRIALALNQANHRAQFERRRQRLGNPAGVHNGARIGRQHRRKSRR